MFRKARKVRYLQDFGVQKNDSNGVIYREHWIVPPKNNTEEDYCCILVFKGNNYYR